MSDLGYQVWILIGVACAIAIVLVAGAVVFFLKRRRRNVEETEEDVEKATALQGLLKQYTHL